MDHAKKALSRVYWQYRNAPKMREWLQILPDLAQAKIETPLSQVADLLDIDTAAGHQLDIIGRIAGIGSRPRIVSDDLVYFGYAGTPAAGNYGEGPYIGAGDQPISLPVPDYLFRVIIKAKIFQNVSVVTLDGVKQAVDAMLNEDCQVVDGQDMTIAAIRLKNPLATNIRKVVEELDLIPRPQGVRILAIEQQS